MEVQQDFKELLARFDVHAVEYVIVGAHALALHGAPRYSGGLEMYVRPDPENAARILAALAELGFGSVGLSEGDFSEPDHVVRLGQPPLCVDLTTSMSGVSWEEVFAHRVAGVYADVPVSYLAREQLIANKRACGRKKDLADLEALGEE